MAISKISVVIRTKNEEKWIGHCLKAVLNQSLKVHEIIVVDNNSSDNTIKICNTFDRVKVVRIKKYLPGYSLNQGIKATSGNLVAIISSHCIPVDKNWLKNLSKPFNNKQIVGVYGKQVPVSYSSAKDIRDLFITFGDESRLQKADTFFHNANSMIRKATWKKIPFDEQVTNIEDRVWAKQVFLKGHYIRYEAKATVFHHHGIHHDQNPERAKSTLNVINAINHDSEKLSIPESMMPGKALIHAVVPVPSTLEKFISFRPLEEIFSKLNSSEYIQDFKFIHNSSKIIGNIPKKYTKRSSLIGKKNITLVEIARNYLLSLNKNNIFPDYILYANPEYLIRPDMVFDQLISTAIYGGYDSTTFGLRDYSDFWLKSDEGEDYFSLNKKILPKQRKFPVFKSLFGLGTLVRPELLNYGLLSNEDNQGLIEVDDFRYSLRLNSSQNSKLLKKIVS